jgi:type I restriction enzyme, S subunit
MGLVTNKTKHTDIGVIPSDWEVKKLSDIGKNIIGLTYSPSKVKHDGTLVLRSSNVQDGKLAFVDNVFVEMELPERVIVKENDVLICVRNGSRHLIGKCALIDKKTAGSAFGAFMSIYRSDYSTFVLYQFQSFIIQRQINETLGATINQITNKDLATFQIPIPPTKYEQNSIVTALSDADNYVNSLGKLIAKKRQMKHGAMQELLTPKEHWDCKKLGEIADFKNGKAHEQFIDDNGDFIVVNSKFVSTEGEVFKNSRVAFELLSIGEIAMVMSDIPNGKALAKCFVVKENNKYTLNQRICSIKAISCNSEFLYWILNRNGYFLAFDSGTGQTNLKKQEVLACPISYPKSTIEQIQIASILNEMNAEILTLERNLEKAKLIKEGMMQQLLTGKIRLI